MNPWRISFKYISFVQGNGYMSVSILALAAATAIASLSQSRAHCAEAPNSTESEAWQRDQAARKFIITSNFKYIL